MKGFCYTCDKCEHKDQAPKSFTCSCGGIYRPPSVNITGTRDSFGIGKEFIDERTGKVVDNYKTWEKLGYREPLETIKNPQIREEVKHKLKHKKPKRKMETTLL